MQRETQGPDLFAAATLLNSTFSSTRSKYRAERISNLIMDGTMAPSFAPRESEGGRFEKGSRSERGPYMEEDQHIRIFPSTTITI
ncbi:hypothetical protein WG66_014790 [Moniliophthora roreri]|nr:hypothetical protein WG66_014790 [Moniliophthora roreri]